MEPRVLPLLDLDGVITDAVDEHTARQLLRRKVAIPVWGERNIVALKVSDPNWFDWGEAAAPPKFPIGRDSKLCTQLDLEIDSTLGLRISSVTARWPSVFAAIPMRPSVFKIKPPKWPIETPRKLYVVRRKRRISYDLPLAA